jgi:hypothetical protein
MDSRLVSRRRLGGSCGRARSQRDRAHRDPLRPIIHGVLSVHCTCAALLTAIPPTRLSTDSASSWPVLESVALNAASAPQADRELARSMPPAIFSSLLVGGDQGASDKADLAGTVCFIFLVSFVFYVTLDLNQPERGLITVSQQPIQRLLSSMVR